MSEPTLRIIGELPWSSNLVPASQSSVITGNGTPAIAFESYSLHAKRQGIGLCRPLVVLHKL